MNLNFAEKAGIFLGATTLTFALGIAACSPLAPSVAKSQLGTKSTHVGGDGGGNTSTNPGPTGLHLLFYKTRDGATTLVGKDGFDWFFRSLAKSSEHHLFSAESFPAPLDKFKSEGRAELEVKASPDWLPSPDGTYSATASLQLDLTDTSITASQVESFEYELKGPSANDVRTAVAQQGSVSWFIQIKGNVDPTTRARFFRALDGIRLTITTKEAPVSAISPVPMPNHALEEAPLEEISQPISEE